MARRINFDPTASLEALADQSGLEFIHDLSKFDFVINQIQVLPYAYVKKKGIIPLKEEEGVLYVAIHDPYDLETASEIKCITGSHIKEMVAPRNSIDEAIETCYASGTDASSIIQGLNGEEVQEIILEEEYDLLDHESDSSIIKILNTLLVEALHHD